MALSRNARRKASKVRVNRREAEAHNNALVIARREARRNPVKGPLERTPSGLVSSLYSGAARPVGYTKPQSFSRGVPKASELIRV